MRRINLKGLLFVAVIALFVLVMQTTYAAPPTLEFVGTEGYEARGVNPYEGSETEVFTFKIRYRDPDGDEPFDWMIYGLPYKYPFLRIWENGVEISPDLTGWGYPGYPMILESGDPTDPVNGAIYSFNTDDMFDINGFIFSRVNNKIYEYAFEAYTVAYDGFNDEYVITPLYKGPMIEQRYELSVDAENNIPTMNFYSSSDIKWYEQTEVFFYDNDAVASGNIGDGQKTLFNTQVSGPGLLKFYWKVSSEKNYDLLRFNVDNIYIKSISGEVDWTPYSHPVTKKASNIEIFWEYAKDNFGSEGLDKGFLDKISYIKSDVILDWTGESNYREGGVYPQIGSTSDKLTFRVNYINFNNKAPKTGSPKLIIYENGSEISSYTMNAVDPSDTNYVNGKLYYYDLYLDASSNYSYKFEALDVDDNVAIGDALYEKAGPIVVERDQPILVWTGEPYYTEEGVYPTVGTNSTNFEFRVKYVHMDNVPPKTGYPVVYVGDGSDTSSYTMQAVDANDTNYGDGKLYKYNTTLASGLSYAYFFEAVDSANSVATGDATSSNPGPDVYSGPFLVWSGKSGFTDDGLNPQTGRTDTEFEFRVKYLSTSGLSPKTGFPEIHIEKDGSPIAGSPFRMLYLSGAVETEIEYYIKLELAETGSYTYQFEAYDTSNNIAIGDPAFVSDPFTVYANSLPVFSWVGDAGYSDDGVEPNNGDRSDDYVFRIKYSDADADMPQDGYPKVHILKGGVPITDSPFEMDVGSGDDPLTGIVYTYTKTFDTPGTDYTYYFETYDSFGDNLTSVELGFNVNNNTPVLTWTGEENYESSGVFPLIGGQTTSFGFRIKYQDDDGDAPDANGVRLYIERDGVAIAGSPFTMIKASGTPLTGEIYTSSRTLGTVSNNYRYRITATDAQGALADTGWINDPDVITNNAPTLEWVGEGNFTTRGVDPTTGREEQVFTYKVKYRDADSDSPGVGFPRVHIRSDGTEITGSPFVLTKESGTDTATGIVYSFETTLDLYKPANLGRFYDYRFSARDKYYQPSTGTPTAVTGGPSVTNNAPFLNYTGETNYTTRAHDPTSGDRNTEFVFRIAYVDWDNDAPFAAPVIAFELGGKPTNSYSMEEVDPLDTTYSDSKTYTFSRVFSVLGNYQYRITVKDKYGADQDASATGTFTVANTAPVLSWVGDTGYETDGVNPEMGDRTIAFTYRIKYSDVNNDNPKNLFPKLHIKKGGTHISGSPFTMELESGTDAITGLIYAYSHTFILPGNDYTYLFEAEDNSTASVNVKTSELTNPNVYNNVPVLEWTNEANYTTGGVYPLEGGIQTPFEFRVKYTDTDGDDPYTGYPKVEIFESGSRVSGSPFAMEYVSGTPQTGAIYRLAKVLDDVSANYSYYFVAYDKYYDARVETTSQDAPDVITNSAPVLSWTAEANYTQDGIYPKTGDITTGFVFRVKYTDTDNDNPYTGYPKVHIMVAGTPVAGSPFAMTLVSGTPATGAIFEYEGSFGFVSREYSYYFEAMDSYSQVASGEPLTAKTFTVEEPLLITTAIIPAALENAPYSKKVDAIGGVAPYRYSISQGALPAGLTISLNTGTISGIPQEYGVFTFTVRATDSNSVTNQTTDMPYTLNVVQASVDLVKVYPNPYRMNANSSITFTNLSSGFIVKVFSITGILIHEFEATDFEYVWDLKNINENLIQSGVYLYTVEDTDGNKKVGKFVVVR